MVHEMQLRVATLIERCQDEIILETTLTMNDDLNMLFVRYDRWLRNSEAARAKSGPSGEATTTLETAGGVQVATTCLNTVVYSCVCMDSIVYHNYIEYLICLFMTIV